MKWVAKKSTKIIIIALIAVLFLIGFMVINHLKFIHEGNKKLDKMTAIADSFKAPEGWVLTDDIQKKPANNLSCPTGGCPSIKRDWKIMPVANQESVTVLENTLSSVIGDSKFECDFENLNDCYIDIKQDDIDITLGLFKSQLGDFYDQFIMRIE